MRNALILALATVMPMTLTTLSVSALATDTRTAIKLCDANPNCTLNPTTDGNNNITMCINGGPAKGQCVSCPGGGQKGDCAVVGRQGPTKNKGKVLPVGVVGTLQPPSGGNKPPKGMGRAPVSVGSNKQVSGHQTGTIERTSNPQHSGGGGGSSKH
jgi:hypothetical protein